MKMYYVILMLALYYGNALAQEYRPLLEEGKTWTVAGVHADWPESPFLGYGRYNIYTLRGENTIDGQVWKQLFCYDMDEQGNKSGESLVALLREEGGKVCFYDATDKAAKLLMNFNVAKSDILTIEERAVSMWDDTPARTFTGTKVVNVGTYNYSGTELKRLDLTWAEDTDLQGTTCEFTWVEGVGEINQEPFSNGPSQSISTFVPHLADCQVNGEILYRNDTFYSYMQKTLPDIFGTGISHMQDTNATSVLFDLQGRRLREAPRQGVYIENGKAVVN